MLLFYCLCASKNKGNHHFVLFNQSHRVADLALKISVLAPLPGLKSILHGVAGHAEFRGFLGMAVIPEAENAANDRDQEEQDHNSLSVFFNEMSK